MNSLMNLPKRVLTPASSLLFYTFFVFTSLLYIDYWIHVNVLGKKVERTR